MTHDELQQVMQSRASMYGLLSRVYYREVDETFLGELKKMRFPQNTGNDAIDSAYLQLYKFLRKTSETVIDDLAVDYARAFIGSGALDASAAYPFESVYTSNTGLTMQEARDEALAIYRSCGLDKNSAWRESEDHLALELLFMKELSHRTGIALKQADEDEARRLLETQRNFLSDHLLNWVGMFAQDVPLYTKLSFYQAFSQLALAYLQDDRNLLAELVGSEEPAGQNDSDAESEK